MEVGIKLAPDGTPQIVTAVPDSPVRHRHQQRRSRWPWSRRSASCGLIGGLSVTEYLEHEINDAVAEGARGPVFRPDAGASHPDDDLRRAPYLTSRSASRARTSSSSISRRSSPSPSRRPAIRARSGGPSPSSRPVRSPSRRRLLGDTWRADNLAQDRPYRRRDDGEPVLRPCARLSRAGVDVNDGADGLTDAMIDGDRDSAQMARSTSRDLREAGFAAQRRRTG